MLSQSVFEHYLQIAAAAAAAAAGAVNRRQKSTAPLQGRCALHIRPGSYYYCRKNGGFAARPRSSSDGYAANTGRL